MKQKIETYVLYCTVRAYGGTYIATGEKMRASCTAGPDQAARVWAEKTFRRNLDQVMLGSSIQVKATSKSSADQVPVQYRCEVTA